MNKSERLELIKNDLIESNSILNSLCDINRQRILLVLLDNCSNGGIRVNDIATIVNLSRPCVSHHLKILLDNDIVSIEHIGTKNYYHITGTDKILSLKKLFLDIKLYVKERESDIK